MLDDEIDTLRSFDPETQRTIEKLPSVELLPAREFPLERDSIALEEKALRLLSDG